MNIEQVANVLRSIADGLTNLSTLLLELDEQKAPLLIKEEVKPQVGLEDVRKKLVEVSEQLGKQSLKAIFAKYGISKLSEASDEVLAQIDKDADTALGGQNG